jgi:hypothetical protein
LEERENVYISFTIVAAAGLPAAGLPAAAKLKIIKD